ncbi:MAG TPA: YfiR family protein [Xanthomonadaceae bacterium]|jgi:hypothetical protein
MNGCRRFATRILLAFALAWAVPAPNAYAAASSAALEAPEPRIKAAFLFKFGNYVEWPSGAFASASSPLTIGVVDADELADELTTIVAGRNVDGHAVVVRRMREGDPVAGLHILFVGKASDGKLAQILSPTKGSATLAVTEADGALDLGSTINFVIVDGKVRFDVALQSAQAGSLKISSRLLAVARKVTGPT